MRIAFLTFEYVSESNFDGGLANYLRRVSIALIEQGHDVEIFTQSTADETIEHEGVLVHRIKPPERVVNWIRRLTRYYYSQSVTRIPLMAWKVRRRVLARHREKPFDLVQSPNLFSLGLALVPGFPFGKPPFPVIVRASSYQPYWRSADRLSPYKPSRSTELADRIEHLMVRRAAAVFAPSELIADAFREKARPDVGVIPTLFLPNDIKPDASVFLEELAGIRYLLFFGTIKVLKGGITLGDALKVLLPRIPDLHMVLVGKDMPIKDDIAATPDTVMNYIFEQAGEHRDRVHHLDKLQHEHLYPIIDGAVGVVLPSRIDNFPNACLEAMALGKAVIGTRGASFDEIFADGVSGILVPKDDPIALAEAMERVWKISDVERDKMGKAAQTRLIPLHPENAVPALEAFYSQILQNSVPKFRPK